MSLSLPTANIVFFWTPYAAGVIRVSPVQAGTIAVSRVSLDSVPSQIGGVVLFDDTVQRPAVAELDPGTLAPLNHFDAAWNEDGSRLYSLDIHSELMALRVSADGVYFDTRLGAIANVRSAIHFDRVNRLLAVDGGSVWDATSAQPIGTYRPAYNIGSQNVALDALGAEVFTLARSPDLEFRPEITVCDATRFVPRKV